MKEIFLDTSVLVSGLRSANGASHLLLRMVAEKIGTLNTVDEFLKARAGDSVPADMSSILDQVPDAEPIDGDELSG